MLKCNSILKAKAGGDVKNFFVEKSSLNNQKCLF